MATVLFVVKATIPRRKETMEHNAAKSPGGENVALQPPRRRGT